MNRPTSISVISWILIVTSLLNFVTTTVMAIAVMANNQLVREFLVSNRMPLTVLFTFIYLENCVRFTCGTAMLGGHDWGRSLFVIYAMVASVLGLAISETTAYLISAITLNCIITVFLFRPNANLYFSGEFVAHVTPSKSQTSNRGSRIPEVASAQRLVIYAILANSAINVSILIFSRPGIVRYALFSIAVLIIGFMMYSVFRLAIEFTSMGMAVFVSILMLFPCVSLIVLLVVNQKASDFLTARGIEVGLMGANMKQVK